MPPKVKITKEDIIRVSMDMVRKSGVDALNARALAAYIGCSTQPIFSNYLSMEDLKRDIMVTANKIYEMYLKEGISSGEYPMYKASGMAYIRFAKEEKELFKLLFMRDRSEEIIAPEFDEITQNIIEIMQKNLGLSDKKAKMFHLEMWIYVHGIATILATSYLPLEWDEISSLVTDMYEGLKKRYLSGEESECVIS